MASRDDPAAAAARAQVDARPPGAAALDRLRAGLAAGGRRVPGFDPSDGGTAARLLVLLETPGPGGEGARLVSRDAGTGTARNIKRFLAEAGIAREETLLWNTVPWIVHAPGARNRPLRAAEVREGLATLPDLLALLPALRVVVLAGRVAARAAPIVAERRPGLPVLAMPHPSPTIVCTSPTVGERIAATLGAAAALLGDACARGAHGPQPAGTGE